MMRRKLFFFCALFCMTVAQAQDVNSHAVARNFNVNQAQLTLASGERRFYNTADVSAIDIDQTTGKVTVNTGNAADVFANGISSVTFAKKLTNAEGVQITEARGWLESAYILFGDYAGASSYHVYVKGGQYADYTLIDEPLVRSYGTYNRADALGLMAGEYSMKVVPVIDDTEVTAAANEVSGLIVRNYRRDGYAHYQASAGIGAYNNDGTLKAGARVIYVCKANAKTVTLEMQVDGKGKMETRTGIQSILQAYEKGAETRPLAVRVIGLLKMADMPELGSSAIGLQVKGKGQAMNLTLEGVGNDATLHGFGVLVRACRYVELRNLGIMMHEEDGISFDTDNEHVWGHNLDIFYGKNKGGDKSKGDGSFDVKGTMYCTVSDNHFWDAGKCNLNSNGDEVDFVSYHHNWYDHSDSRHPRVRKSQHLHVFNNYYDGNSKYGVGATTGSCIFVEKNYFRNCKYPMLISKQGSDIHNGVGSSSDTKGTFSSEDGGIIKAFDNYMTGQKSFEPYVAGHATYSRHFDAYVVQSREEQVPAEVVTLQGGTGYNNFDTDAAFYTYSPDATSDVPAVVTGHYGAGRCDHGDFQYTFNNATEDSNSDVIIDLSNKLANYTSTLQHIYGDLGEVGGEPGGGDTPGDDPGDDPGDTPQPQEGVILASFDGAPSHAMFTMAGDYGDGKITYDGTYYKKGVKLNSKGSITFTPQHDCQMTLVLATAKPGRDVTLNEVKTTVGGTENTEGAYYELQPIALSAGVPCTLTKGSAESILMLIKLVPIQ
jgi:pectate lyase